VNKTSEAHNYFFEISRQYRRRDVDHELRDITCGSFLYRFFLLKQLVANSDCN